MQPLASIGITLPGGVPDKNGVLRNAHLRPMTGHIEQQILEAGKAGLSMPFFTTAVLTAAVESIGQNKVDEELVDSLSIGDRHFLMLQLAALLFGDQAWIAWHCKECGSTFDINFHRSLLPVKKAGASYPCVSVKIKKGTVVVRVPNGADQRWISQQREGVDRRKLLKRCRVQANGGKNDDALIDSLNERDIERIETALEQAAPDIGTQFEAVCPECAFRQAVTYDVCRDAASGAETLYDEVHAIAMNYHWDEERILALPRERRRRYLRLIERHRGVYA